MRHAGCVYTVGCSSIFENIPDLMLLPPPFRGLWIGKGGLLILRWHERVGQDAQRFAMDYDVIHAGCKPPSLRFSPPSLARTPYNPITRMPDFFFLLLLVFFPLGIVVAAAREWDAPCPILGSPYVQFSQNSISPPPLFIFGELSLFFLPIFLSPISLPRRTARLLDGIFRLSTGGPVSSRLGP